MRIKLDENLPTRLVSVLAELGHDIDTVPAERIAGRNDAVVWQAAQAGQRFLVTQDLDFSDIRKYTPGTPPHSRTAYRFRCSTATQDNVVLPRRPALHPRGVPPLPSCKTSWTSPFLIPGRSTAVECARPLLSP